MKKLIDFDGLFDEKLAEYMQKNSEKYTEQQWEALIPKLYRKFGETFIPAAQDTPRGYYASMDGAELVHTLAAHVKEGVPASDFLCREVEARGDLNALIGLLSEGNNELSMLAVNLIGAEKQAFDAYFDILRNNDSAEELVEAVCEQLKAGADAAKERAIALKREGVREEIMLEILSRCKEKDDAVFEMLLTAFRCAGEELPMRASYLAAYGDVRALPVLLEVIDRDDINFLEYQELKYAIEALGGEYTTPRDFSNDPYFQAVLAQQTPPPKSDA